MLAPWPRIVVVGGCALTLECGGIKVIKGSVSAVIRNQSGLLCGQGAVARRAGVAMATQRRVWRFQVKSEPTRSPQPDPAGPDLAWSDSAHSELSCPYLRHPATHALLSGLSPLKLEARGASALPFPSPSAVTRALYAPHFSLPRLSC